MSASGMTIMWFLAPPKHCTRLPLAQPRRIDVFARSREEPTKPTALMSRIVEDGVDRFLVAVDDIEHARRQAGLDHQFGERIGTTGSRSDGLRMKALPQAMRRREFPHRDHRREIERRDAGDDAERLAHRIDVDAGAGAFGVFALQQMRNAAGEFDHFEPALDVALGVGKVLPCSRRQQLGEAVIVASAPVRGISSSRGRGAADWSPPRPAAPRGRSRPLRAPRLAEASATAACTSPVVGLKTSAKRPDVPLTCLPPIKWVISATMGFPLQTCCFADLLFPWV